MSAIDPARSRDAQPERRGRLVVAATAMLCVGILAALALAEVVLRARHFEFLSVPKMQFGWPEPELIQHSFQTDPDLLWVTHDYQTKLARARTEHARVIFMGDSCIEFSRYPHLTLARLGQSDPTLTIGEKLGVPGWSSEQGRAQIARDVAPIHPRVITIEFGWNDHWDALGPPDDQTHPGPIIRWASEHLRVYQAYRRARLGLGRMGHPDVARRVSLARYRDNLRSMADEGKRIGARVVFITAPTDHESGHEPSYLKARHLQDLSRLVPLHQSYVQATRDVAALSGASLCDAASAMASLGRASRRYFRGDGIHFNDAGDEYMGNLVAGCIEAALRR